MVFISFEISIALLRFSCRVDRKADSDSFCLMACVLLASCTFACTCINSARLVATKPPFRIMEICCSTSVFSPSSVAFSASKTSLFRPSITGILRSASSIRISHSLISAFVLAFSSSHCSRLSSTLAPFSRYVRSDSSFLLAMTSSSLRFPTSSKSIFRRSLSFIVSEK